jgi:hypothetical protein
MKQLLSIQLVAPGSFGLNTQASTSLLDPVWATLADNMVIDSAGRIAARDGWNDATTTPISGTPTIEVSHEFRKADGTTAIVSAANAKLYSGTDSFTDITGSLTPAANDWQFTNFEDKCIGIQQGETPIVWTGAGNFAAITPSAGTLPTGNTGVAAYGRLWIADADKKTIKYCTLLDETDWASAGSGTINMEQVWDVDEIVSIAAAFGKLIVFGKRNIVVWGDAIGSTVGLDPSNLFVEDIISGTGSATRDGVQNIGEGDLWYLSQHGVQSMVRVIQEKNNPLASITQNNRDYVNDIVDLESGSIRSVYDEKNSHYILAFPSQSKQIVINAKRQLPDGTYPVTNWAVSNLNSLVYRDDKTLLFGFNNGEYGSYQGNLDGATAISVEYRSGWLSLGEEIAGFVKIFKRWDSIIFMETSADLTLKMFTDFQTWSKDTEVILTTGQSQWGIGVWGLSVWGGGKTLQKVGANVSSTAQYVQLGLATDAETDLSIQQFNLIVKRGRMAL